MHAPPSRSHAFARPSFVAALTLLAALSICIIGTSQHMVKKLDSCTLTRLVKPVGFEVSGKQAYFVATTQSSGNELWRTDGTAAGTHLVQDIRPGPESSNPSALTALGGTLYFLADDGQHGQELWKTDGTPKGTALLRDINVGPKTSNIKELTVLGKRLIFLAQDASHGQELWASDGTTAGTTLVLDARPGLANGSKPPLLEFKGKIYFPGPEGSTGTELWSSDGTATGTRLLKNIAKSGGSNPGQLTTFGNHFYFSAGDGPWGTGYELWRSDGTAAGTTLFKDIYGGRSSSMPGQLTATKTALYLLARDQTHGRALWKTDGTTKRLVLVPGLAPGRGTSMTHLTANGSILFFAVQGTLWRTNGSLSGTMPIKSFGPISTNLIWLASISGSLFLSAQDDLHGTELWRSNGTSRSTVLVRDIAKGSASSWPGSISQFQGKALFSANDNEVWLSNGTAAGTKIIASITNCSGAAPESLTAVDDRLIFLAKTSSNKLEMLVSDGTSANTTRIPGQPSSPANLVVGEDRVFFSGYDKRYGNEIWSVDSQGRLATIWIDASRGSASTNPTYLNWKSGGLYFFMNSTYSTSLYRSRGTAASTKKLATEFYWLGTDGMTLAGGRLYFAGSSRGRVQGLCVFDGGPGGSYFPLPLSRGGPAHPREITTVGHRVFFSSAGQRGPVGLWESDGSMTGTRGKPLGGGASNPTNLTAWNGTLYFTCNDPKRGSELWRSGTAGTVMVKDIRPGVGGSTPESLVIANNKMFFVADDGKTGRELWISDGTAAGTRLFKDINPGSAGSNASSLAIAGSGPGFVFQATNGIHGKELWYSDGTTKGTSQIADIQAGPGSSNPTSFTTVGRNLFFTADDGLNGKQLWVIPLSKLGASLVRSLGKACLGKSGPPKMTWSGLPLLGTSNFQSGLEFARASSPGLLLLSTRRSNLSLGNSCTLYPAFPMISVLTLTNTSGKARTTLPIPMDTNTLGLQLILQYFTLDQPYGAFNNLGSFSDALQVIIGR